jgi:Protein-tyrosine phosphatase.
MNITFNIHVHLKKNIIISFLTGILLQFLYVFSDGGGRSGVYLAIDANLELAEEEDCFDVFGYLKKLRQSRKGLIETLV